MATFYWPEDQSARNSGSSLSSKWQLSDPLLTFLYDVAPFTSQSTEYVTVTNNSEQNIAFKVKTTAPKFYCVRPNAAVVAPGEQVQVQVILLGLAEEPTPDFKCRDKFLVITLPAPYDLGTSTVTEAWPQLEAEFKQQAVSKKIKVKYLFNEESKTEEPAVAEAATVDEPVTTPAEKAPVQSAPEIEEKTPVKNVAEKKEAEVPAAKEAPAAPVQQLAEKTEGPLSPSIVLFVALIALFLGWMYY